MAKVVAISGLGEEASGSSKVMLAWGVVIGTAVGIFVGTLLIKPSSKRRGA